MAFWDVEVKEVRQKVFKVEGDTLEEAIESAKYKVRNKVFRMDAGVSVTTTMVISNVDEISDDIEV